MTSAALLILAASTLSCESLRTVKLPNANATIVSTQMIEAGPFDPPRPPGAGSAGAPPRTLTDLPHFCRVAATLRPTPDSDIEIEVWLPILHQEEAAGWNGKFQAVGNGGWSGAINYSAMGQAIRRGYATASTDTGHAGSSGEFALGHPEKLIDFAWRSEHEMTIAAKALIAAFYGTPARHSYWVGCSAGGRQGLKEAQRFPQDYDGIIAGAPANDWTGRAASSMRVGRQVHETDPQIAPGSSVDYYARVLGTLGGHEKVDPSYRLFMVPGMAHCGGGEGPNQFDMLSALEQWVEKGNAPGSITASRIRDYRVERTRPLCPYPQVARYNGTGGTDDAANFTCGVP